MTIPAELLANLPPYAIVREHPTSSSLYLLTRAFVMQASNPRAGASRIEYPTETRLIDATGNDLGAYDQPTPWVTRIVTDELLATSVTMTTPSGPLTLPLGVIYLGLATLFAQWWAEDRAAATDTTSTTNSPSPNLGGITP